MPTTGFTTIDGVLHADQVPLPAIAAAVGTPAYVYCANTVRDRFRRLDDAFAGVPHHIHLSLIHI